MIIKVGGGSHGNPARLATTTGTLEKKICGIVTNLILSRIGEEGG